MYNIPDPTSDYIAFNREINLLSADFDAHIFDVFRALPNINRFNGQTLRPYSVASHSLMCEKMAYEAFGFNSPHLRIAVLLHDAAEAYLGDIVRPIKTLFVDFAALEKIIMKQYLVTAFWVNLSTGMVELTNKQYVSRQHNFKGTRWK